MTEHKNGNFLPQITLGAVLITIASAAYLLVTDTDINLISPHSLASIAIAAAVGLLVGLACSRATVERASQAQLRAESSRLHNRYSAEQREAELMRRISELRADHARREAELLATLPTHPPVELPQPLLCAQQ